MAELEITEADLTEILDECTPRARLLIVHLLKRVAKLEQRVVDLESQLFQEYPKLLQATLQRGFR